MIVKLAVIIIVLAHILDLLLPITRNRDKYIIVVSYTAPHDTARALEARRFVLVDFRKKTEAGSQTSHLAAAARKCQA